MKIGITGATGFIGSHLAEELLRRGHEVRCLVRPTSNLRWIRSLDVELCRGDPGTNGRLGVFLEGLDALVHAAGSKFAPTRSEFERANETLTTLLLDEAERVSRPPARFVYISSIAAAGPSPDGRPLTEDSQPHPITTYGMSKLRTERLVSDRAGRIAHTILRPPAVYGPRDSDILPVFRMARVGVQLIIGRRNALDLIYVKNLVEAICLVLTNSAAENRTYHVADECPYTWEIFTRHIHQAMGRKALTVAMPFPLLEAAGWVGQRAAWWIGTELKLNDEKVREMKEPYWLISTERARTELGYKPRVGVEQAIAETLEWYRAEGWL